MVGLKEMGVSSPGKGDEDSERQSFTHLFPPALVSAMVMTPGVKEGCQQRARLKDRTPRVAYHKQQMEMWPKRKKGEDKWEIWESRMAELAHFITQQQWSMPPPPHWNDVIGTCWELGLTHGSVVMRPPSVWYQLELPPSLRCVKEPTSLWVSVEAFMGNLDLYLYGQVVPLPFVRTLSKKATRTRFKWHLLSYNTKNPDFNQTSLIIPSTRKMSSWKRQTMHTNSEMTELLELSDKI